MKNMFSPPKFASGIGFSKYDASPAGNAFVVMGRFEEMAKKSGWSKGDIDLVLTEAMSSDYDHLIETINTHIVDDEY